MLLLIYGAGAVIGNFLGGWLADKALLPSLIGLLGALTATLAVLWTLARTQLPTALLTFILGTLAFAVIPGMQIRVLTSAAAAPTLAVAVNASGFQLAAALAGWLGGRVIDSALGLHTIYLTGAALTLTGLAIAVLCLHRDRATVAIQE